jgi:hypothetical protein
VSATASRVDGPCETNVAPAGATVVGAAGDDADAPAGPVEAAGLGELVDEVPVVAGRLAGAVVAAGEDRGGAEVVVAERVTPRAQAARAAPSAAAAPPSRKERRSRRVLSPLRRG